MHTVGTGSKNLSMEKMERYFHPRLSQPGTPADCLSFPGLFLLDECKASTWWCIALLLFALLLGSLTWGDTVLSRTLSIKNSSWLPQQGFPVNFCWMFVSPRFDPFTYCLLSQSIWRCFAISLPFQPCYLLLFLLLATDSINPLIQNPKHGYCRSFLDCTEYTFGTKSIFF